MADYYTPGTPATKLTLARAENIATELTTIKASFDKIPEQLSLEQSRQSYALDTGAANVYAVALPTTITAYVTGMSIRMKAVNANTGASTLNADGVGAKTITRINGDALSSGDIPAGSVLEYYYDGTNFQLSGAATVSGLVIGTDVQAFGAILDDFNTLDAAASDGEFIVATGAGAFAYESGATVRTSLGLVIGTDVQAYDAQLADVAGLAVTNGNFIVGDGANFVAESGATARTSMGVGTGDTPTFTGLIISGTSSLTGTVSMAARLDHIGDTDTYLEYTANQIEGVAGGASGLTLNASGVALNAGARITEFSIDGTLAGDSDTAVPTEKAAKTYADAGDFGVESEWIYADRMVATTTNGAAKATLELATNDIMLDSFNFDTSTDEYVQWNWAAPKRWNEGTFTFNLLWTAASGSGGVSWVVQALSVGNDDAMDAAVGSAVQTDDTLITANDLHISGVTPAMTPSGSPAENDMVIFRIRRATADVFDTLAVDAKLIGVRINYTTNAGTDD